MKRARDIMTANPQVLQSGDEIKVAQNFFLNNVIQYAPVLNPMGEVMGLLSQFGLVRASLRNYIDGHKKEKLCHSADLFDPAVFVEEDASLDDVVKLITKSLTHRLLVVTKQQKLIGIISPKDLLGLVAGEEKKSLNLKIELDRTHQRVEELSKELDHAEYNLDIYRHVFDDSPNMMHSVDPSGKIIMANKKIHQVLGYEPNEMIGMMITDIYPKSVHHEAIDGLKTIMETGNHHMTYTSMLRKNGQKIRIDISSSALRDAHGKFVGTISISREVDSEELLRALNGISTPSPQKTEGQEPVKNIEGANDKKVSAIPLKAKAEKAASATTNVKDQKAVGGVKR